MNKEGDPLGAKDIFPMPQTRTKAKILIGTVFIFTIIVGTWLFRMYRNNFHNVNNQNSFNAPVKKPTLEFYYNFLVQRSKLNFSPISSQISISRDELSLQIKKLILNDSSSVDVQKVVYSDKKGGHMINYQIPKVDLLDLERTFSNVFRVENLEILRGERTELAGLFDLQNNQYKIRILYGTESDQGPVKISVQTIIK